MLLLLLIIFISSVLFGNFVPVDIKIFLYSVSLGIKEVLSFTMPFIIFSLMFNSINNLKNSAIKFIILLFAAVFLSNLLSSLLGYFTGYIIVQNFHINSNMLLPTDALGSLWNFKLPILISNFQALILGVISGMTAHKIVPHKSDMIAKRLAGIAFFLLKRILIPIMPLFILGFILKLQHDQILLVVFKDYIAIFTIMIVVIYLYVILLYGIASSFNITNWLTSMKNMAPALVTAIATSSSSATIPVTLEGCKKNVKEHDMVDSMVPVIASTSSPGNCFCIIVLALVIIESFGTQSLTIWGHLSFLLYFLLLKFTAAAPGSNIIVVLGILEGYLHFSPAMLSLITAIYVMINPIITGANVTGDGALIIIFTKLYKKFQKLV